MTAGHDRIGPLLVTLLGVAALAPVPAALAQARSTPSAHEAISQEVVISATRLADEALTAKVVQVLNNDPYLFAPHISVLTENGVVRLEGFTNDLHELRRALVLARRAAGQRRVLNEVEFMASDDDAD